MKNFSTILLSTALILGVTSLMGTDSLADCKQCYDNSQKCFSICASNVGCIKNCSLVEQDCWNKECS